MTEGIIYTLKWKDFKYNVKSRVSDVIKEQSFCDVTLVTDQKDGHLRILLRLDLLLFPDQDPKII